VEWGRLEQVDCLGVAAQHTTTARAVVVVPQATLCLVLEVGEGDAPGESRIFKGRVESNAMLL
jgi:hypothetical protein